MTVLWAPAALQDVERIYDYIASFNQPAAKRIASRLFEAGVDLARFSERGRPAEDGTRELTIVWPYVLVYEVLPSDVMILRIWHGAQDR